MLYYKWCFFICRNGLKRLTISSATIRSQQSVEFREINTRDFFVKNDFRFFNASGILVRKCAFFRINLGTHMHQAPAITGSVHNHCTGLRKGAGQSLISSFSPTQSYNIRARLFFHSSGKFGPGLPQHGSNIILRAHLSFLPGNL